MQVRVLIDNDVIAFWNGTEIGRAERELCPIGDPQNQEIILDVVNPVLGADNLLAIRARDRGNESFIDVRVTAVVPVI